MTTLSLIEKIHDLGARILIRNGEIEVHAPRGFLTPELKEELRKHKPEFLEHDGWLFTRCSIANQLDPTCLDIWVRGERTGTGHVKFWFSKTVKRDEEAAQKSTDLEAAHA